MHMDIYWNDCLNIIYVPYLYRIFIRSEYDYLCSLKYGYKYEYKFVVYAYVGSEHQSQFDKIKSN